MGLGAITVTLQAGCSMQSGKACLGQDLGDLVSD